MTVLWRAIPVLLALAGTAAIALWLTADPTSGITERTETPTRRETVHVAAKFPGVFTKGVGVAPAGMPGAWPTFRGPNYDAVSPEETPLARTWGPQGPKVLWAAPMGTGYAGPAILNGRVYVLDYDETKQADTLRCLSLETGQEIWRRGYEIPIDPDHGISRTVPAATEKYVVTFGPKCHVMCVDAASGDFRWGLDLVKEYRAVWPKWYAGQCPVIDGGRAILAPAGPDVLMLAVDCETGQVAWKTPNPHGWRMTHSSILPMDFAGRRMYVYCSTGGVTAVAAADGPAWKAGDVLWERSDWQVKFANVPTPVVAGEGLLLLSGGYASGAMMIRLKEDGARLATEVVWRVAKSKEFGSEQQTPVFYKGSIYAILPKEAGSLGERLICMAPDGKHAWASEGRDRFGLGPYMIADGLVFAMDDDGLLSLVEASPAAYKRLAQAKVLDGHEAWAPMAIAGGRLLVRDLTRMVCLDVRKND